MTLKLSFVSICAITLNNTMDTESNKKHLLKILTEAVKNKIYGSVEIYFEEGKMTQVTQRIINKMHTHKKMKITIKASQSNNPARHRPLDQDLEIGRADL